MKYLILGAGGTGGAIGGFLAASGKDVDFVARGAHLQAMKEYGLKVHSDRRGELFLPQVRADTMEDYSGDPDVIFLCVKGYSVGEAITFLKGKAKKGTLVIPILNIYGTGEKLSIELPDLLIPDGCMYIVSYVSAPGEISQRGKIFRVVYGMPDGSCPEILHAVARDLEDSGIDTVVSAHIQRDCFQKFSCVSAMASAGAYFDTDMGTIRSHPEMRQMYRDLSDEICSLADAMGIPFQSDVTEENLDILDHLTPDTTASMQKDLKKGGQTEMDGLIFEVVRLGKKFNVPVPQYTKIAKHFGFSL